MPDVCQWAAFKVIHFFRFSPTCLCLLYPLSFHFSSMNLSILYEGSFNDMFIINTIWNCEATQINNYFTSECTLNIHEMHPNIFIFLKRSYFIYISLGFLSSGIFYVGIFIKGGFTKNGKKPSSKWSKAFLEIAKLSVYDFFLGTQKHS